MIMLFGFCTLFKEPELRSEIENRELSQLPQLTITGFLNGSFQKTFESALSDQFIGSNDIRANYKQAMNSLPKFGLDKMVCKNRYLELYNSKDRHRAAFNCEDYLVYYPDALTDKQRNIVEENIKKYNHLNTLSDVYYYFVNDSSVMDFTTNQKVTDYTKLLKQKLKGKYHFSSFEYKDFNDYKKWFYKTDHHWDYRGSYRGYQEITKLLKIPEAIKPVSTFTDDRFYYGSLARTTQNLNYHDDFSFYIFDLPKHSTKVNRKPVAYDHLKECAERNEDYRKSQFTQYSICYGNDFAEVIYDFNQPKKENLLVIANSFSNPINALIAMNYNKTYIIDLRHFKNTFGFDFNFVDYTTEHDIKKTLLILSPTFIFGESTHQGLEG